MLKFTLLYTTLSNWDVLLNNQGGKKINGRWLIFHPTLEKRFSALCPCITLSVPPPHGFWNGVDWSLLNKDWIPKWKNYEEIFFLQEIVNLTSFKKKILRYLIDLLSFSNFVGLLLNTNKRREKTSWRGNKSRWKSSTLDHLYYSSIKAGILF